MRSLRCLEMSASIHPVTLSNIAEERSLSVSVIVTGKMWRHKVPYLRSFFFLPLPFQNYMIYVRWRWSLFRHVVIAYFMKLGGTEWDEVSWPTSVLNFVKIIEYGWKVVIE